MLLDAIALVNWAVDPECSLWLSRVGDVSVPALGVWPPGRVGVLGPRHWPSADALASLPSVEMLVLVANIAHGLAGGAAYVLRREAASNSLLVSSAFTLLIEGAIFALPAGECLLRTAARFLPLSVLDCDLSSAAG